MAGQNSDQHNALIDEFKKAHRKMFKNGFMENEQPNINHSDEHDKITSNLPKQQDNQLQVTILFSYVFGNFLFG